MVYFYRILTQNYIIFHFLFVMGCECSQANSITPQQPHIIEVNPPKNVIFQNSHQKLKGTITTPVPGFSHDKENKQPKEPFKEKQKEYNKVLLEKNIFSEAEMGSKQTKKKDQSPILDCKNLEKQVIAVEKANKKVSNEQKLITSRSQYKKQKDSAISLLSSKTIEQPQSQKKQPKGRGHRVNEFVEVQKLVVENENKGIVGQKPQSASKIKIKSLKQVKSGSQELVKLQNNNFVFEHWEKQSQDQQISKTERLRRKDEMQIQRQEVNNYLNSVWDYEKEVLNNIIASIQLNQHKKFEQPVAVIE